MDELKRKEFTRIVNDWKARFPMLSKYSSSKLFMRADFLWIGLCFENDRFGDAEYRVFLEIRRLWTDPATINIPYIYQELFDEKKHQLFIKYSDHDRLFEKAVKCVERQFGAILKETIPLSAIYKFLIRYSASNDFEWLNMLETRLAIAMFFNNKYMQTEVKKSFNYAFQVINERDSLNTKIRKLIEEWEKGFHKRFESRAAFMEQLEQNTAIPKIARLKNSPIIFEPINVKFHKPPKILIWLGALLTKLHNRRIGVPND